MKKALLKIKPCTCALPHDWGATLEAEALDYAFCGGVGKTERCIIPVERHVIIQMVEILQWYGLTRWRQSGSPAGEWHLTPAGEARRECLKIKRKSLIPPY